MRLFDIDTKEKPAPLANIGPVNNVLHSLIESLTIKIAGYNINVMNENYGHKAYLTGNIHFHCVMSNANATTVVLELFENDMLTKLEKLQPQGWFSDGIGLFDNVKNDGWKRRRQMFLTTDFNDVEEFTSNDVTLIGVLKTDLRDMNKRKRNTKLF